MVDIAATAANYEQLRNKAGDRNDRFVKPSWMSSLSTLGFNQKKMLRTGKVMAAALVQANNALFQEGHWDLPGLAVYSDDPYFTENDCARLRDLAKYIFGLKGMKEPPKEVKKISNFVTNEYSYPYRVKLPDMLSDGHDAYLTTLQFSRKMLPGKKITETVFPVITVNKGKPDAIMLPGKYWVYKEAE